MNVTRIGLDLAKNVFELYGVDEHEQRVLSKTVRRGKLLETFAQRIAELARASEPARRLMQVEGVGPLTATAITATVGDGRQFAAWLGLVARQHSSGGKARNGRIAVWDQFLHSGFAGDSSSA
jgi:transposase